MSALFNMQVAESIEDPIERVKEMHSILDSVTATTPDVMALKIGLRATMGLLVRALKESAPEPPVEIMTRASLEEGKAPGSTGG